MRLSGRRMTCLCFLSFLLAVALATTSGALAGASSIWTNTSDANLVGPPILREWDLSTGNEGQLLNTIIATGYGANGRGVAQVGNMLYYTSASTSDVYSYDLQTGSHAVAFTVATQYGAEGLSALAYDGSSLYIQEYGPYNNVYKYLWNAGTWTPQTPISLQGCLNHCDGLEYANGKLISNRQDQGATYDVYNLTGGAPLTSPWGVPLTYSGFINPGINPGIYHTTGIAFDGTNYFVASTEPMNRDKILVFDSNGTYTKTITLQGYGPDGDLIEDLSVDYAQVLNPGVGVAPGVRTPGFWNSPNGKQFWDGLLGNETKAGQPGFAVGELLAYNDSNGAVPGGLNANPFIILGGDHDGVPEAGEINISLADALNFIDASAAQQQDARWKLARDAVATELNIRAGNPGTDSNGGTVDPQHLLDDAVAWLDLTTNNDHVLTTAELSTGQIPTSDSVKWQNPYLTVDHAASVLHTELDGYNNTGLVFGVQFAHPPN
jgi:hypothetical protein